VISSVAPQIALQALNPAVTARRAPATPSLLELDSAAVTQATTSPVALAAQEVVLALPGSPAVELQNAAGLGTLAVGFLCAVRLGPPAAVIPSAARTPLNSAPTTASAKEIQTGVFLGAPSGAGSSSSWHCFSSSSVP